MTSKNENDDKATEAKTAPAAALKKPGKHPTQALRKAIQDDNAGRGGSYVLDPSTGKRTVKHKPPTPRG